MTSLPSTLTAKKSMKMTVSSDKIYCNFSQENPKITNISHRKKNPHRRYTHFKEKIKVKVGLIYGRSLPRNQNTIRLWFSFVFSSWINNDLRSFKLILWPPRRSSSAKTIVVSELKSVLRSSFSPLSEFTSSSWRRENAQSGVVYRTRKNYFTFRLDDFNFSV